MRGWWYGGGYYIGIVNSAGQGELVERDGRILQPLDF
jgi:hypothetical protein